MRRKPSLLPLPAAVDLMSLCGPNNGKRQRGAKSTPLLCTCVTPARNFKTEKITMKKESFRTFSCTVNFSHFSQKPLRCLIGQCRLKDWGTCELSLQPPNRAILKHWGLDDGWGQLSWGSYLMLLALPGCMVLKGHISHHLSVFSKPL